MRRNAQRLVAEAQRAALEHEGRELSIETIGGRIAEVLGVKPNTAARRLRRGLDGSGRWTPNLIHGLAMALGVPQSTLTELPDRPKVSDATTGRAAA